MGCERFLYCSWISERSYRWNDVRFFKIVILLAGVCYLAAMILLPVRKGKKEEVTGKQSMLTENYNE